MSIYPLVTCAKCTHRCGNKSLNVYNFVSDVERSEAVEEHILRHINLRGQGQLICRKTDQPGYPDLEIALSSSSKIVRARLEVKFQTRAFMKVSAILPQADLVAWETIALNLSDLERYIKIYRDENIPTHLVWRLQRHCLGDRFLYQDITVLGDILDNYRDRRRYKRATGSGDVDEHGKHRGVLVNYHFSVNELIPFNSYLDFLDHLTTV